MTKLLKIEFKKILTYKVFWILIISYFVFLTAGVLLAEFIINSMVDDMNRHLPIPLPHVAIYFFPNVWQNIVFFATIRYFMIFPAIVIIILITNEFTFKTVRQNVINGLSKAEFLTSKLLLILLISIVFTVLLALGSLIIGLSNTSDISLKEVLDRSSFVAGYFFTIFFIQVYAFFFGFLLRNTGLSIALMTLYVFIVEPIIYYFMKSPLAFENKLYPYLPVNAVHSITEYPSISVLKSVMGLNLSNHVNMPALLATLVYAVLMIGIIFRVMSRKDL